MTKKFAPRRGQTRAIENDRRVASTGRLAVSWVCGLKIVDIISNSYPLSNNYSRYEYRSPQPFDARVVDLRYQRNLPELNMSTKPTFRGRDKQRIGQIRAGAGRQGQGRLNDLLITGLVARDDKYWNRGCPTAL